MLAITSNETIPSSGATTANGMIVTPITMPSGNKVTIQGLFPALSKVSYYKKFADFTGVTQGSKSFLQINTSKYFSYLTYGNDYSITASSFPNTERAEKVVIDFGTYSLYVYGANGTVTTNTTASSRWKARTTPFRVFLSSDFYVTRVTQEDSSGTIIHNLVPYSSSGVACLKDIIDGSCYFAEESTAAYLTTF